MPANQHREFSPPWCNAWALPALLLAVVLAGCGRPQETARREENRAEPLTVVVDGPGPEEVSDRPAGEDPPAGPLVPSPVAGPVEHDTTDWEEIPLFAANSPFDADYEAPALEAEKRLWARSFLWEDAPEMVVEKWLSEEPDTRGKYVLVEFWATWCGPCRRSIPRLNEFHRQYGEELIVIGISDETAEAVRAMQEPKIEFFSAVDPQARMKDQLGVHGIPHAILIEPGGAVVWEGFPLLENYQLTDEIIQKTLAVGRKLKAQLAE